MSERQSAAAVLMVRFHLDFIVVSIICLMIGAAICWAVEAERVGGEGGARQRLGVQDRRHCPPRASAWGGG